MQVAKSVSETGDLVAEIPTRENVASEDSRDLGFVYFFGMEGSNLIKIGFTGTSLNRRYRAVRQGCPAELIPIGYFRAARRHEKELHRKFSKHRNKGEWFGNDGEISTFIEQSVIPFSDLGECQLPVKLRRDEFDAVCDELSRWIESWSYDSNESEWGLTEDELANRTRIRMRHPTVATLA